MADEGSVRENLGIFSQHRRTRLKNLVRLVIYLFKISFRSCSGVVVG